MFLDEETMYCRDNALRAIIKLGNIKNILEVLKRIKKSKYYFSVEMLYENLLEYNKEKQILAEKIWQKFDEFNENTQIAIIKFITNYKLNFLEEFYNLLEKNIVNNKIKVEIIK